MGGGRTVLEGGVERRVLSSGAESKVGDLGTMLAKLADAHTLKVTYRSDGKVRRENTFVLSEDGKTIVETQKGE